MGRLAFVFAGQGAQYTGMGSSLADHSASAKAIFDLADSIREGSSNQCKTAPKEELSLTVNTQPCLFCVDLMAAEALKEKGIMPDGIAGFSLGEIPALAFGGYLSYRDAFQFVIRRGISMDNCAKKNPGAMLAVLKLDTAAVEEICKDIPQCYPVNYNCKGQTVVACHNDSVERLTAAVKEKGGKAMKLAVSGAFHSPFMEEAAKQLEAEFAALTFMEGAIPVYANVTAQPYTDKSLLFRQVNSPVQWEKTILNMAQEGFDTFIEVGPGKTLCGLISKILPDCTVLNVEDESTLHHALEVLNEINR